MSGELLALATEMRAEINRSQRAVADCRDGFSKMMLAAEFGSLCKTLLCIERAASGMSTGTAKTPKAVEGRSPASPIANGETPSSPPSDLSTDKDG